MSHGVRRALPCAALFLMLLALVVLRWGPLLSLDAAVSGALHRTAVASPGWTRVSRVLSDWVWDPWAMRALLAVAIGLLVRRGAPLLAVWVGATALAGTALQQLVKALVGRARPVWPDPVDSAHYAAFPSGHAMSALVAGVLLLWLLRLYGARPGWRWTARVLVVLSVVGVGCTRVFLGVHWPSDVLGGWLLGGAVVAGSAGAYAVCARRWAPRTVPAHGA
ncbi:phosphatase PAP2 family protein [Streptomyces lydicus]|uniref:Putative integral membrane protein n=1 Tax=Streptomyces lydicus TaxID=47763 RepID=D1GLW2_9ACTN|nr:phosphatase PAP2 family protein [Streptomyces lydicus]UEG90335.1 phosphatase PAP2 family protein [Streptomyces lydicus]CBA11587.1 putative integral membrane protein [Streptomyces lydicus]